MTFFLSLRLTESDIINIKLYDARLVDDLIEMLLPLQFVESKETANYHLEVLADKYTPPSLQAKPVIIGHGKSLSPFIGYWETTEFGMCISNTETKTNIYINNARNKIKVSGLNNKYPRDHIRYSSLLMNTRAVIVELITRLNKEKGNPFIHASCVIPYGHKKSVMFVGHKGAGKTTLLSSFLADGGKLISADRTYLSRLNGVTTSCGAPDSFRISTHSLRILRTLAPNFTLPLIETEMAFSNDKYHIPLLFLRSNLDVKIQDKSPLGNLVIIESTHNKKKIEMGFSLAESASFLKQHILPHSFITLPNSPSYEATYDWKCLLSNINVIKISGYWSSKELAGILS